MCEYVNSAKIEVFHSSLISVDFLDAHTKKKSGLFTPSSLSTNYVFI